MTRPGRRRDAARQGRDPQRRLQLRRRRGRLRQPRHRPVRPGLHPAHQVPRRGQPASKSECVPHLGVETETFLGATFTYDYGVPTFALCGEVGLTAGPSVLGAKAISLDAGLGVATYDDRPSVLRAFGDDEGRRHPVRRRHLRGPHRRLREGHGQASTTAGTASRPSAAGSRSACSARSSTPRAA